ncbi:hypothetical protein V8C44DRAFT_352613 [Trichoderma aethiopicum]
MGLAFSARLLGPRLVRVKPSEPSGERQMLGWPVVVPAHPEDLGRVVSKSICHHCHQTVNCPRGTTQTCSASPRRESIVGTISQRHRRDEGREEQEREFRSSPTMAPLSRGASCVALSRRVFGSLSLRLPKMRCTHPKAWAPSAEKLHAKSPKSHVLPRL